MLILWIVLAIAGALLFLAARETGERGFRWAGILAFIGAVVVFVLWLVDVLESEGVDAVIRLM